MVVPRKRGKGGKSIRGMLRGNGRTGAERKGGRVGMDQAAPVCPAHPLNTTRSLGFSRRTALRWNGNVIEVRVVTPTLLLLYRALATSHSGVFASIRFPPRLSRYRGACLCAVQRLMRPENRSRVPTGSFHPAASAQGLPPMPLSPGAPCLQHKLSFRVDMSHVTSMFCVAVHMSRDMPGMRAGRVFGTTGVRFKLSAIGAQVLEPRLRQASAFARLCKFTCKRVLALARCASDVCVVAARAHVESSRSIPIRRLRSECAGGFTRNGALAHERAPKLADPELCEARWWAILRCAC